MRRALFWGLAVAGVVAFTAPSEASASSPVSSISSNCSGSDAWVAQMAVSSDDPGAGGNWRLDSPFSQPPSGGFQPQSQGFLIEQTVPLDQATVTLSATVSFEGGASGVVVSRLVDRPDSCVLVAPPVGPVDAPAETAADAADEPADEPAPVSDDAPAAAVTSAGVPESAATRVDEPAAPEAATAEPPVAPAPEAPVSASSPAPSSAAPAETSASLAAAPTQNLPATGDEVTVLAVLGGLLILAGLGLVRLGGTRA